jgi:hypothetical protein
METYSFYITMHRIAKTMENSKWWWLSGMQRKLNCKHFYFVNTKMYNTTLAGGENNDNKF